VSQAAVVAVGVRDTGEKSVLGLAVGASETEAFWLEFCRSLARRGLSGVQLVISDAHEGLRSALSRCSPVPLGSAARCTSCATWPAPSPSFTHRPSSRW
jgi:transposase-like protein